MRIGFKHSAAEKARFFRTSQEGTEKTRTDSICTLKLVKSRMDMADRTTVDSRDRVVIAFDARAVLLCACVYRHAGHEEESDRRVYSLLPHWFPPLGFSSVHRLVTILHDTVVFLRGMACPSPVEKDVYFLDVPA
ncbi:MAG: hypothetical protein ABSD58_13925 [Verrucomicrobiia bacterium]|jgi:hypothetical protein